MVCVSGFSLLSVWCTYSSNFKFPVRRHIKKDSAAAPLFFLLCLVFCLSFFFRRVHLLVVEGVLAVAAATCCLLCRALGRGLGCLLGRSRRNSGRGLLDRRSLRLGRGLLGSRLRLLDGRDPGERLLQNRLIRQRLVVAVTDALQVRAEGEARLADRGLRVLVLLQKRRDARAVNDPGALLARLLLLVARARSGCRLLRARLLGGHSLQSGDARDQALHLLLQCGDACSSHGVSGWVGRKCVCGSLLINQNKDPLYSIFFYI